LVISAFYTVYAIRAGHAQVIYYQAKNGKTLPVISNGGNKSIFSQCQKAQLLYPHNYRLFLWSAEEVFNRSIEVAGDEQKEYRKVAGILCDRGLDLNCYLMPLPLIKTQLLSLKSIKEGIGYWEKYVEWDYWNSYNHAVLAGLYAADGKFGKAMQSLQFIKGTEDFAAADKIVQDYWKADSAMPVFK
jgi:hypothetical protein